MTFVAHLRSFGALALLERTRELTRTRRGRLLGTGLASFYALVALFLGGMAELGPEPGPYGVELLAGPQYQPVWYYPAVVAIGPHGILVLPYLPTLTMALVSIGVGMGGAVALLQIGALFRLQRGSRQATGASAAAGAAPPVVGVATLGACCCTTCIGATGLAVVAGASGASLATVIAHNWYVDLFELAVVWLSLMVQERGLLRSMAADTRPAPPPLDLRFALGSALRVALLIAGITWSLAMFIEWAETSPISAPAAVWYHWIFEHQLISAAAILVALFPEDIRSFARESHTRLSRVGGLLPLRVCLVLGGLTWGLGVPPPLVSWGLGGFLNELLGYLGNASPWAETPDATLGAALLFHWLFQHLLLSSFALVLAIRPALALAPLRWSVSAEGRAALRPLDRTSTPVPAEAP